MYVSTENLIPRIIQLRKKSSLSSSVMPITVRCQPQMFRLEDLKVMRRSSDLLNNVKIGQVQLQPIMEQLCSYHIHFGQVT